jgi:hypothetical protein
MLLLLELGILSNLDSHEIPNPEISKGTLLSILKQAGLARNEFFDFA